MTMKEYLETRAGPVLHDIKAFANLHGIDVNAEVEHLEKTFGAFATLEEEKMLWYFSGNRMSIPTILESELKKFKKENVKKFADLDMGELVFVNMIDAIMPG